VKLTRASKLHRVQKMYLDEMEKKSKKEFLGQNMSFLFLYRKKINKSKLKKTISNIIFNSCLVFILHTIDGNVNNTSE
jgi:hypothetical protein